jgi:hypothetical protein
MEGILFVVSVAGRYSLLSISVIFYLVPDVRIENHICKNRGSVYGFCLKKWDASFKCCIFTSMLRAGSDFSIRDYGGR